MSQPDQRGDIWKYLIQDEIIYQYFKTATVDTISLPKYVNLVKARPQAVLLARTQQDTSLPSFTPQPQELTQWYYRGEGHILKDVFIREGLEWPYSSLNYSFLQFC